MKQLQYSIGVDQNLEGMYQEDLPTELDSGKLYGRTEYKATDRRYLSGCGESGYLARPRT